MEKIELTLLNFCCVLEACNADQRSILNEVLETFCTFIEEILRTFHITVDSSQTINVELFFQHHIGQNGHLQPEQQEEMINYLTRLQEANEDRLNGLKETITMCRPNLKEAKESRINSITMCRRNFQEMSDLLDFLTVTTNIIQGLMVDEDINVEEISKRNLEEMIGRYTDLQEVDEKHGLRPLLQACIDFLQTNTAELWKQVCITISGEDDKIASGTRKHQFVCRMKNGKPFITEETPVLEHKKPKSSCTSSTETTHKPSKKMDNFELTVTNFCRTLEACSAEQRSVANEVLKSFSTFVEEILLTFHIRVGASDTINVKELLFKDLVDLSHNLQPEQHEHVISCLTRLQEATKDRISSLNRTITLCSGNLQIAEREVLQKKMKEQEKKDIEDFLIMTTNIIKGIRTSNPNDSSLKTLVERMKNHRGTFSYQDEVIEVEEINKRNLGKMIIRHVGHEGVDEKPGLRRLFQACIDFLQREAEGFWKNASITIYDEDTNMYKIASGTRKHQFICRMKTGEPDITEKKSVSEHKKPKPTKTSNDPSQTGCSIS